MKQNIQKKEKTLEMGDNYKKDEKNPIKPISFITTNL